VNGSIEPILLCLSQDCNHGLCSKRDPLENVAEKPPTGIEVLAKAFSHLQMNVSPSRVGMNIHHCLNGLGSVPNRPEFFGGSF